MYVRRRAFIISLHIRSMWETTVMHKQVSGWTVNFGPNSPVYPFLELKTRIPPPHFQKLQIWDDQSLLRNTPPIILENFRFGMIKVYSEIPPPPHFQKLQIWDDQSLLRNTPPPILENFRFGMTKVYSKIPPPILEHFRFGMTKVYSEIPPPHFGKLQIWDDQSLLRNTPPPFWKTSDLGWPKFTPKYPPPNRKLSESSSLRFSEYRELLHVETLSNPDNY